MDLIDGVIAARAILFDPIPVSWTISVDAQWAIAVKHAITPENAPPSSNCANYLLRPLQVLKTAMRTVCRPLDTRVLHVVFYVSRLAPVQEGLSRSACRITPHFQFPIVSSSRTLPRILQRKVKLGYRCSISS